jgi:hypothetical protein
MRLASILAFTATLLFGFSARAGDAPAGAPAQSSHDREMRQQGMSAAEAANQARQQTGGRVLRVREGPKGHQVKVLTPAGEIREILVPGRKP